ncbi:MAG: hypothetical protein ACJ74T_09965 [Pyrinomonadaceae bacterium]
MKQADRRQQLGFYADPAVDGDVVVFLCDHSIWQVSVHGGRAKRLTPRLPTISTPLIETRRGALVFAAAHEGPPQVCVIRRGDPVRQLTHFGGPCRVLGWSHDGRVVFSSSFGSPFRQTPSGCSLA